LKGVKSAWDRDRKERRDETWGGVRDVSVDMACLYWVISERCVEAVL